MLHLGLPGRFANVRADHVGDRLTGPFAALGIRAPLADADALLSFVKMGSADIFEGVGRRPWRGHADTIAAIGTVAEKGRNHLIPIPASGRRAARLCVVCTKELAALIGRYADDARPLRLQDRKHTSELQSLMRISYAVFCLKKKKKTQDKIKPLQ